MVVGAVLLVAGLVAVAANPSTEVTVQGGAATPGASPPATEIPLRHAATHSLFTVRF